MLIGMRNAMMAGGGKLSAKSYIQDGLVAMWDGIENAGWGVHDANATVWKDLIGGFGDWQIPNSTVYDKYIHLKTDKPTLTVDYSLGGTWQFVYGDIKNTSSPVLLVFGTVKSYTSNLFMFPYYYFYASREQWWLNMTGLSPFPSAPSTEYHSRTVVISSQLDFYDGDAFVSTRNNNFSTKTFSLVSIGGYNNAAVNMKCHSIRYYSRALTADEIAANYAVDKARFNLPDAT